MGTDVMETCVIAAAALVKGYAPWPEHVCPSEAHSRER